MQIQAPLKALSLKNNAELLIKGSKDKTNVRALQMLLYGLGYGPQLGWGKYRADGDYGGGTSKALALFKDNNNLGNDGTILDATTMTSLLDLYAILPTLKALHQSNFDTSVLSNDSSGVDKATQLAQLAKLSFATNIPNQTEAETAFNTLKSKLGENFLTSLYEGDKGAVPTISSGSRQYIVKDDWSVAKFNKHKNKKGVWALGSDTPKSFIENNESLLIDSGLSESDVRVITPVSANEGNLNAVNTWDNCFMTFGMFQWTLGQSNAKGELPAMLQRLKNEEPDAFQEYFGQYGIDFYNTNKTVGYLTLNGSKINTVAAKEKFRKDANWAFRFWKSGLDSRVNKVQIGHALDRINSFLRNDNYKPLNQFFIGDLITSEYGLCLILDHHVNRPGHLMSYRIGKKDILGQALKKAGLQNSDPSSWGTNEEQKLIKAYLPLRYASSMTHSKERATKIKGYLDNNLLSSERFSYEAPPQLATSRSLDALEPYSVINHLEYENREQAE